MAVVREDVEPPFGRIPGFGDRKKTVSHIVVTREYQQPLGKKALRNRTVRAGSRKNGLHKASMKRRRSFGQDRGIGRYTSSPQITKRTTANLKTENNQNCQKIKPYGSPTKKELKKHSFILVGGAEMGS